MGIKKQNIPVNIVLGDYYDNFCSYIGKLGDVSPAQAQQIIDGFAKAKINDNSCIQTMSLERTETVQFGRPPFQNNAHGRIDMECLFYFGNNPKCAECRTNKEMTEEQKYKTCHRNFRNGRCVDKNMREILGKVLYPQHYGKLK